MTETKEETPKKTKKKEDPKTKLLKIAINAWKTEFWGSVPYKIMRTFAHHRAGEDYDTGVIFRELEAVNKGKHDELVKQIDAFEKTLLKEHEQWIDENSGS